MDRNTIRLVLFTVAIAMVLIIAAIAVHAQVPCVLHPNGDIVPCVHFISTPYGIRTLHPYDIVPCVHFVPC